MCCYSSYAKSIFIGLTLPRAAVLPPEAKARQFSSLHRGFKSDLGAHVVKFDGLRSDLTRLAAKLVVQDTLPYLALPCFGTVGASPCGVRVCSCRTGLAMFGLRAL